MEGIEKRIKKLRTERNMTQKELAKQLGLVNSAISNYENGIRTISIDALIKIADFFNVDINFLTGRSKVIRSSKEDLIVSDEEIELIKEIRKAECYKNVIAGPKKFVKIIENRTRGYDVEIEDVSV